MTIPPAPFNIIHSNIVMTLTWPQQWLTFHWIIPNWNQGLCVIYFVFTWLELRKKKTTKGSVYFHLFSLPGITDHERFSSHFPPPPQILTVDHRIIILDEFWRSRKYILNLYKPKEPKTGFRFQGHNRKLCTLIVRIFRYFPSIFRFPDPLPALHYLCLEFIDMDFCFFHNNIYNEPCHMNILNYKNYFTFFFFFWWPIWRGNSLLTANFVYKVFCEKSVKLEI